MTTTVEAEIEAANRSLSSLVFYPLLFLTFGLWLLHRWQQSTRYFVLGNKIPGPKPLPLIGNALMGIGKRPQDILELAVSVTKQYGSTMGNVMRIWVGPRLVVCLSDPHDIEVILDSHIHIDKSDDYKLFKPWLGDGLLISTGEKWRSHRKMIAPTFHINILKNFVDTFNKNSKDVVDKMKTEIGKQFDVHDYMSGVTVETLIETVMGNKKKFREGTGFEYAAAVMKMCDIIHQRHYKLWLQIQSIFKLSSLFQEQIKVLEIIHNLANKVFRNKKIAYAQNKAQNKQQYKDDIKKESYENASKDYDYSDSIAENVFKGFRDDLDFNDENDVGEKKRLAFLEHMIETAENESSNLSDVDIKDEVNTIMFEGHDTLAAASSFTLCLLGVHKGIQMKVYEELYEIFGDSDRPATFADTLRMKYLERVIYESLRLFPPVPMIARKLNQEVKLVTNDCVLPAGGTVVIGIYNLHRNPKYYKNPESFDPDHFLPEITQNRPYYSFVPFSAGPRSCVGRKYAILKLKVLLSTILRNYKIVSDITEDQFRLQADIILKRADGFNINIEPRKTISA